MVVHSCQVDLRGLIGEEEVTSIRGENQIECLSGQSDCLTQVLHDLSDSQSVSVSVVHLGITL